MKEAKHPLLDIPNRYNSISNITNQSNMIQKFCSIKRNEVTMIDLYKKCNLCPRKCSIDRTKTLGYCKVTDKVTDFQIYCQ